MCHITSHDEINFLKMSRRDINFTTEADCITLATFYQGQTQIKNTKRIFSLTIVTHKRGLKLSLTTNSSRKELSTKDPQQMTCMQYRLYTAARSDNTVKRSQPLRVKSAFFCHPLIRVTGHRDRWSDGAHPSRTGIGKGGEGAFRLSPACIKPG